MTELAQILLASLKLVGPCTFGALYGHMGKYFEAPVAESRQAVLELWDLGRISVGSDFLVRPVE